MFPRSDYPGHSQPGLKWREIALNTMHSGTRCVWLFEAIADTLIRSRCYRRRRAIGEVCFIIRVFVSHRPFHFIELGRRRLLQLRCDRLGHDRIGYFSGLTRCRQRAPSLSGMEAHSRPLALPEAEGRVSLLRRLRTNKLPKLTDELPKLTPPAKRGSAAMRVQKIPQGE
jgi:hypothetical protein